MSERLSALWGGVLTNRWGRIALALLAGAGAALAHPPFGILPGLLGYPLLMLLAERSRNVKGGFWVGWLAGFSYFFIGCWWVAEAFLVNPAQAWMAPFAASLLPAGLGLFWGAATGAYRKLHQRGLARGLGRVLLFAVLFATIGRDPMFRLANYYFLAGIPLLLGTLVWHARVRSVHGWWLVAGVSALFSGAACLEQARSVAVIVCGGVGVTAQQLADWRAQLGA